MIDLVLISSYQSIKGILLKLCLIVMTACFKLLTPCFPPYGKERKKANIHVMHVKILVSGVCLIEKVHVTPSLFIYPEYCLKNY